MLTANTVLVLIIAGGLVLLSLVTLALAMWHDRVVTAAGPTARIEALKVEIEQQEKLLHNLEDELANRRAALADVAGLGAEVDALRKQKEELLAEWNSLEDKREEVQKVRDDIEALMAERLSLEAELGPLRAEYLAIKEELEKAKALLADVEKLKAEHQDLTRKVYELRDQLRALEDAERKVEVLKAEAAELETKLAALKGTLSAKDVELEEFRSRVSAERELLTQLQAEKGRTETELAQITGESRRLSGEIEKSEEALRTKEARLAYLEGEIQKLEGKIIGGTESSPDGDTGDLDKLRDLKVTPPVIAAMSDWEPAPLQNEADALMRVRKRLVAKGLAYPDRTLHAFHTAMKVNETTQMAVLAGISGTGKSQLPRQYAAGMGIGFLQVPVQPRWDSPQDLMGFYNYIEGKFRPTDMARALWTLDEVNNENAVTDRMMMILLDEMNLARVEYYFSDFLSRLESRPSVGAMMDQNERKDSEIELEIPNMEKPPRIFPGYNLLFAGTMNEDESTQSLSDKVIDRANIIRFAAPKKIMDAAPQDTIDATLALSRHTWRGWVRPPSHATQLGPVSQKIEGIVEMMRDFKRPFGHRLGRAIQAYVANYPEVEGASPFQNALADQVEMRLLPKLRGIEVDLAATQFAKLKDFVSKELGDDRLAEAIEDSVNLAAETNGQFVWSGVTR